VFQFIQMMLGLRADAPHHTLFVEPALPSWLPELDLCNLVIGATRLDMRFFRQRDGTSAWEVLAQHGPPLAIEQQSWREADAAAAATPETKPA
jgi:hypothetical protein